MEEENLEQEQESAAQEQEVGSQDVAGEDLSTQEPAQAQPEQQEETAQQSNFRALREQKELIARELELTRRRLQEAEGNNNQQQASEPEDDFGIGNDDLAEGRHLRKVNKEVQALKKQLAQQQQQSVEDRIHTRYSDFDSVVSQENIQKLAQDYPEMAKTLDSSSDLYSKAVSAYTMIKKLGFVPDNKFDNEKKLAQQNSAKPRPLTSVSPQQGNSPLTQANAFANGLTPELKKALYKEMVESRRG